MLALRMFMMIWYTGPEGYPPGGNGNYGAVSRSASGAEGHTGLHRALRGGQRVLGQANDQGVKNAGLRRQPQYYWQQ